MLPGHTPNNIYTTTVFMFCVDFPRYSERHCSLYTQNINTVGSFQVSHLPGLPLESNGRSTLKL
jgi:hypothetical protein